MASRKPGAKPSRLVAFLVAALFLWRPDTMSAQGIEGVQPCLKEVGDQLARFFKGKNVDTVDVGAFTTTNASDSLSPGIQNSLAEFLTKHDIRVMGGANLKIKGEYSLKAPKDAPVTFSITARVVDGQGKEILRFPKSRQVRDVNALPTLMQVTQGDIGASPSPEKATEAALQKPSVDIDKIGKTKIRAEARSPYAVEIKMKDGDEYHALPVDDVDGKAFVALVRGKEFAVQVTNDSGMDAAVRLSLDGLDVFTFSEDKRYRHMIVPAKSSALVKGWFRSLTESDHFVVTEYPKSAAFQLGNPSGVGAITVAFAFAWDPKERAPKDESSEPKALLGIGQGRTVKVPFKEVQRVCGRNRAVVTVRYKKDPVPGD